MKKITLPATLFVLTLGLILHVLLGTFLVEELVFGDAFATMFEKIMYHIAVLPPFAIAILFYKETQNLLKSLGYSGFFYLISFILVALYHFVPNETNYATGEQISLGSYGFYVTGGGYGAIAILPQVLLTIVIVFAIHRYLKK